MSCLIGFSFSFSSFCYLKMLVPGGSFCWAAPDFHRKSKWTSKSSWELIVGPLICRCENHITWLISMCWKLVGFFFLVWESGIQATIHAPQLIPFSVWSKGNHAGTGIHKKLYFLTTWSQESNHNQLCEELIHQPAEWTLYPWRIRIVLLRS